MRSRQNWNLYAKRADFNALSDTYGIDKVVARILVNRGINEEHIPSFLHPSRRDFLDPHLLPDIEKSVDIIDKAIHSGEKIRIIGDYDIDGICSTHILKESFRRLGGVVDYYLPKRIEDGYGMNERMAETAYQDGVSLIVTCDNGIAAAPAIKRAKELGITVVVTDHHEIPKENGEDVLPPADTVVDPKRSDSKYPFKEICGAMVAWKLVFCLFDKNGLDENAAMDYLEFAAFATVGDIMLLHGENRSVVSMGLKKMVHSKNTGLRMLIESCGLNGKHITAYHVGFVLGPCLNAGGRLDDASLGVELFETEDRDRAIEIAKYLIALNEERKEMTVAGTEDAVKLIEEKGYDKDPVIVAYVPGVHESLCGIIAGRLKERYTRPCFMLTDGESYVKGSGRSIPAYSMFDELCGVKESLLMYGGHPMAAGLSIDRENIQDFREGLLSRCTLQGEDLVEKVMIDVAMPIGYITLDLVRQLEDLEPFGNGNEKPLFAQKGVTVWRMDRIGRNNEYLKLLVKDGSSTIDALVFSGADDFSERVHTGDRIDILYYPGINEYRGVESLQIVIKDFRLEPQPEDDYEK